NEAPEPEQRSSNVIDLMQALRQSVSGRGKRLAALTASSPRAIRRPDEGSRRTSAKRQKTSEPRDQIDVVCAISDQNDLRVQGLPSRMATHARCFSVAAVKRAASCFKRRRQPSEAIGPALLQQREGRANAPTDCAPRSNRMVPFRDRFQRSV